MTVWWLAALTLLNLAVIVLWAFLDRDVDNVRADLDEIRGDGLPTRGRHRGEP